MGRRIFYVDIGWGDANKHRQRITTIDGRQVEIRLPRGTALDDGVVLWDDGAEIGVVRRPKEPALVVTFAEDINVEGIQRALLLGYLLGNQHAPLEISAGELRTPLMTSESAARAMLDGLGLTGEISAVELAAHGWTNTSAGQHRGSHTHRNNAGHNE